MTHAPDGRIDVWRIMKSYGFPISHGNNSLLLCRDIETFVRKRVDEALEDLKVKLEYDKEQFSILEKTQDERLKEALAECMNNTLERVARITDGVVDCEFVSAKIRSMKSKGA